VQLDKFLQHEITFISFVDEKLFTVALLRTHKMIWYARQWQPNSATSVPAVFCTCIILSASP